MTERDTAIKMIYKSVKGRAPFALEEFVEMLSTWEVEPLTDGGETIGGVLLKGNEMHVGFAEKPKSSIRRYIRSYLKATIDKYGCAVTSVSETNTRGLRFCERLGFVKFGEHNGNILLRCDRSHYL